MKFPLSWLKEYIKLDLPTGELSRILTMAGIEVDAILKEPFSFDKVVVGKVKAVQKHPNADKLCVATVFDGTHDYQVVCGALNCREGMKTAFAVIGATLTDAEGKPFKIKNTKIRGVESFGMLCSSSELNLPEANHDGIIELPESAKEGTELSELFSDSVFEVAITPNLGHCANLIGIARELSAATNEPYTIPKVHVKEDLGEPIQNLAKVEVLDKAKCPRYTCRVIKNVKIGPSPAWLKKRIEAAGLRSINNVVDITNYILIETGHPLHAFDYDKLAGHQIIVRSATEGERFVTLDGKERILNKENLLICDRDNPVALAGVMGGLNSEVSDNTVNVLLESAYFTPVNIRRSSKQSGLITDASQHFVRGTDPNNCPYALDRATMLIQEIADGKVASGIIDIKEGPFVEKTLNCRLKRVNDVLGLQLSLGEVESIFQRLGFSPKSNNLDVITVKVPTNRVDITGEIDLVEEVARIYGYDNFTRHPAVFHASTLPHSPIFLFERQIRTRLIAEGLQEFLTCDLIGPTLLSYIEENAIPKDSIIQVLNPTSIEQSALRPSLLPGLLQVVKYNIDHQNRNIAGFEIGKIHFKVGEQYKEQSVAGIILTGENHPQNWGVTASSYDFYDIKGVVETILKELGIDNVRFKENALNMFHTGRQAAVFVGTLAVGSIGEIHPTLQRRLDITQRIYYAELNLHDLFQVKKELFKFEELPIYPSSERDWTITLAEETPILDVFDIINKGGSRYLEEVTLLDIYRSDKLGKERKNATFHFVYRDRSKTIEQEVVDAEHERLTKQVLNALGKVVI